eukprot:TRINITY_DN22267_c0_g1_i1.p1 TRINITY_DN22267_c0_g1~~TRINITY_DN22267_c0_g1_i1.p1  ORF type:complete len:68 (-),score=2.74 TRINITY_DN22267_c0_g1_i1:66-269(-)
MSAHFRSVDQMGGAIYRSKDGAKHFEVYANFTSGIIDHIYQSPVVADQVRKQIQIQSSEQTIYTYNR